MKLAKNIEVDAATLCALLGLTPGRISQLQKERPGIIVKAGTNRYRLFASVRNYIGFLKTDARPGASANARLANARARKEELRIAREEHQLVYLSESLAMVDELCAMYNSRLTGLPAQYTRDLGERQRLDALINALRTDVADLCARRAAELEATGEAPIEQDEDETEDEDATA